MKDEKRMIFNLTTEEVKKDLKKYLMDTLKHSMKRLK